MSVGSSNLAAFSRASPPLAGPKERAAKIATRSTAARVETTTRRAARNASESRAAAIAPARAGVASYAMPEPDFYTAAVERPSGSTPVWLSWSRSWSRRSWTASIARRGTQVGEVVTRGELSPANQTRLRLVRRLVFVVIILIGVGGRRRQVPRGVSGVATGILASSAVLGLVVGFAARQTLANGDRRDPARDHPADPDRRPRDLRGGDRRGRGHEAHLHLHPPRRRPPPDRAERAPGAELGREPHDRRPARAGGGVGLAAAGRRPRQGDGADRGRGRRTSTCRVAEVDKEGVRLSATTWASEPRRARQDRRRAARATGFGCLREHALSSTEA